MKLSDFKFLRFKRYLQISVRTFLDFLFPKKCLICNKLLPLGKELCFCDKCFEDIDAYKYVYDITPKNSFYKIISGVKYENYIRERMLDYKFRQVEIYGKSYGYIVSKIWEQSFGSLPKDNLVVICVPMHASRQRLYNQAKIIAEEFCTFAKLDTDWDILVKKRGINQISGMPREMKRIFAQDAFEVINSWRLKGKTVILIDDIYTTGATAEACSDVLLNNGADAVIALTPCYTPKH